MNWSADRYCPHCKKTFYVHSFRLQDAKTLSCYYCQKRFKVQKESTQKIKVKYND